MCVFSVAMTPSVVVTTPSQKSKMALRKGKWRPEEDHKLICYIRRYGIWNWNEMPRAAGLSRSGKSCRLRWMNYLRPFIRHGNFSKEEEDTIFKLHEKLGNRWSAIAAKLPGRTDNDIKNYWNSNLRKRLRKNTASATKLDGLQTSGGQLKKHLSEGTVPKEIPKSSSSNMANKTDINQDVAHQNITAGLSKVSLDFKNLQGQSFSMEGLHIMEDNGKILHPFASDDDLLGFFPPMQNIDFSGELQYLTWHEEPVYSYNYQDDLFEYPTLWYDEYQVIKENNNNELSELSGEVFQSLWEQQSCPTMEDVYTAKDESEREGPGHPFEDFPACYSNQLSSGEIQFLWDYPFLL